MSKATKGGSGGKGQSVKGPSGSKGAPTPKGAGWPSKEAGKTSGGGRLNNPPKK